MSIDELTRRQFLRYGVYAFSLGVVGCTVPANVDVHVQLDPNAQTAPLVDPNGSPVAPLLEAPDVTDVIIDSSPEYHNASYEELTPAKFNLMLKKWHSEGADLGHAGVNGVNEEQWNQAPVMHYFDGPVYSMQGATQFNYKIVKGTEGWQLNLAIVGRTATMPLTGNTFDLAGLVNGSPEVLKFTGGDGDFDSTVPNLVRSLVNGWNGPVTPFILGSFEESQPSNNPFIDNDQLNNDTTLVITAGGKHINSTGNPNLGTSVIAGNVPIQLLDDAPVATTLSGSVVAVPGEIDFTSANSELEGLGISKENAGSEINRGAAALVNAPDYDTVNSFLQSPEDWPLVISNLENKYPDAMMQFDNANDAHIIQVQGGYIMVLQTAGTVTGAQQLTTLRDGRVVWYIDSQATLQGSGSGMTMKK